MIENATKFCTFEYFEKLNLKKKKHNFATDFKKIPFEGTTKIFP